MDGKSAWRDNVFTSRFGWSLKYEHHSLHAYDDLSAARDGIGTYIEHYTHERKHSSPTKLTPVQANERRRPASAAAAPPPSVASGPTPLAAWKDVGTKGSL